MLWPLPLEVDFDVFCQRAGGQGSSSSASGRGAGRAHRDVRLEGNQDLNSKMRELPRRKRAAVWGERSGARGCVPAHVACALLAGCTGGSCCSRGSSRSIPWTSGVEVSTWALPKFSSPRGRVVSPAGLCALFTCCWQHQLMALPLATLPDGCLTVLEPPQLRQPLQPFVHSCQPDSCVWEPVGALGV